MVVAAKATGVPPVSHTFPNATDRDEGHLGVENKETGHGNEGIVLEGSQNAETHGLIPQDAPKDPEQIREEQSATIVQATFRGYLVNLS